MSYKARPSKSGYAFTQTSTLLHLLRKKKLIRFNTIGAWSILAAGGDEHVAVQSTLHDYVGQDAARDYVNELLKFGFLVPTKDPRFTKKVNGGKDRRAFDLIGTPDLTEWLTSEELEGKERFVRSESPTYTDEYKKRQETRVRELYQQFSENAGFLKLSEGEKEAYIEMVLDGEIEVET